MAFENIVPFRNRKHGLSRRERGESIPFFALRNNVDRLFDDFFKGFDMEAFGGSSLAAFSPKVSVEDRDREIEITAELPGLDDKDVEISLADDVLTITGEKKNESESTRDGFYRSERSYGSFSRSVQLPAGVDEGKIEASMSKGVLTIKVSKPPEVCSARKKIAIKSS